MRSTTVKVVLALAAAFSSCTSSNVDFCDEATSCDQSSGAPFCDLDSNSCVPVPRPNACNAAEPCESIALPFCGEENLCVECADTSDCSDDLVCDTAKNSCVACVEQSDCGLGEVCTDNNCGSCTPGTEGDIQCSAADAMLPYCGRAGTCVACLESQHCDGVQAPACDRNQNVCVECQLDSECSSGVCSLLTAECVDANTLLYVDSAVVAAPDCGGIDKPCKTISAALLKVTTSNKTIVVLQGDYPEQLNLVGLDVTLVGSGNVKINPSILTDEQSAVSLSAGAAVELRRIDVAPVSGGALTYGVSCNASAIVLSGLTLQGAGKRGLNTDGCTITLKGVTALNNSTVGSGAGISCFRSTMTMTESVLSNNANGGMTISDCEYSIENSMFLNNGGSASDTGGVSISFPAATPGLERFQFNTVFGNQVRSTSQRASGIHCVDSGLVASSNIIVGGAGDTDPVVDAGCSHSFSLLEVALPGNSNITGDPMFVNEIAFKLSASSPCIDSAEPAATLTRDIDDDDRPQGQGHDMGADEFVVN